MNLWGNSNTVLQTCVIGLKLLTVRDEWEIPGTARSNANGEADVLVAGGVESLTWWYCSTTRSACAETAAAIRATTTEGFRNTLSGIESPGSAVPGPVPWGRSGAVTKVGFQYGKGLIEILNGFGVAAAVRVCVHDRPAKALLDGSKIRRNGIEPQHFGRLPRF